jgi:hypothetical protein
MPTPRTLHRFVVDQLGLQRYLAKPGDGRPQPVIAARVLLWAMLLGRILREISFYGMEQIVRVAGCRVLGLEQSFSNDTLSYFVERLDPATSRAALLEVTLDARLYKQRTWSAYGRHERRSLGPELYASSVCFS